MFDLLHGSGRLSSARMPLMQTIPVQELRRQLHYEEKFVVAARAVSLSLRMLLK